MTFRAAQPLSLEWFGGLNTNLPKNDLPPFAAARADNCVFPGSSIGKRHGFTNFWTSRSGLNSLVPIRTAFPGYSPGPCLLLGTASGAVEQELLAASPASSNILDGPAVTGPVITTAEQFYQRAIICQGGSDGYGQFATSIGGGVPGSMRFAAPMAPTLAFVAGPSTVTAGVHAVALSATFVDGSQGPIGPTALVTIPGGSGLQATWTAAEAPNGGSVASISVWISQANDTTRLRRAMTVAPDVFTATYTLGDNVLVQQELAIRETRYRSPKFPMLAVGYAGRLAYFGEPHRAVGGWMVGGSQGTDFGLDSYTYGSPSVTPGGWTVIGAPTGGLAGFFNYRILFDGATAARTRLENIGTVIKDLPGIARLVGTGWSGDFAVRIRAAKSASLTTGTLRFGLSGTTGSTARDVTAAELTTTMQDFVLTCNVAGGSLDLKLFIEGIGPGVNNEAIYVSLIECFDPNNVSHRSTVWWSEPLQLRTVDSLTGGQTFNGSDGEVSWLGFEWQGRFYVAKDSSLWVTQQNGAQPSEWPIEKVSDLAGACGRRSIAHGPDFKVLINRTGAWLFQGTGVGPEANLATDISADWEGINWSQAWQIWGAVDEYTKRVYIGVPRGSATVCDAIYVLDYADGFAAGSGDGGRKWSIWPIGAAGGCVGRRYGATKSELWITRADSTSIAGYLDDSATNDWLTAGTGLEIPWVYETGRMGSEDGALGLFRRIGVDVEGSGLITMSLVKADDQVVTLPSPTLYTPMRGTQHVITRVVDERVALRFQTVGNTSKALVHRVSLWMRRHPFGAYRPRTP